MIQFGVPKQRVAKKEEVFPNTPVVTMQAWEGKGYNKRFVFNNKAIEALELEPGLSRVNFAFDGDTAYIAKQPGDDSVMVGKNLSISNKRFYDYICKIYELDEAVDNHLELADVLSLGDIKAFLLKVISNDTAEAVDPEQPEMPYGHEEPEVTNETESEEEEVLQHYNV